MTGYEEILTDPSYAGQIITFTFPHIGVVGANDEDIETVNLAASGGRARRDLPRRDRRGLELPRHAPPRRLAESARDHRPHRRRHARPDRDDPRAGMPNAVIAHNPDGHSTAPRSRPRRRRGRGSTAWTSCPPSLRRSATTGTRRAGRSRHGYGRRERADYRVVAIDYGIKRNILQAAQRLRLRGDGRAGDGLGRGHSRAEARRRLPVERPGRSGRNRQIRGADDPGAARDAHPAVRDLSRPPDARHWRSARARSKCRRAITAPTIPSRTSPPTRSRSCR